MNFVQGVPSACGVGEVDLNFECFTVCPILPGLMGIWQKRLCSWARWMEHPNQSTQPRSTSTWDTLLFYQTLPSLVTFFNINSSIFIYCMHDFTNSSFSSRVDLNSMFPFPSNLQGIFVENIFYTHHKQKLAGRMA